MKNKMTTDSTTAIFQIHILLHVKTSRQGTNFHTCIAHLLQERKGTTYTDKTTPIHTKKAFSNLISPASSNCRLHFNASYTVLIKRHKSSPQKKTIYAHFRELSLSGGWLQGGRRSVPSSMQLSCSLRSSRLGRWNSLRRALSLLACFLLEQCCLNSETSALQQHWTG